MGPATGRVSAGRRESETEEKKNKKIICSALFSQEAKIQKKKESERRENLEMSERGGYGRGMGGRGRREERGERK